MLYRDYFMRLVQELAVVIARVLFLKEQKKYDDALDLIRQNAKTLAGIDLDMVRHFSVEDLLRLFNLDDSANVGKFIALAVLLKEEGSVFDGKGDEGSAYESYTKSFVLYCEALKFTDIVAIDTYRDAVDEVIDYIISYKLSEPVILRLIKYYEMAGRFSKAEDLIFENLDKENILTAGISFFKKLLLKKDDEIEAGELTREEAERSLEELNRHVINK